MTYNEQWPKLRARVIRLPWQAKCAVSKRWVAAGTRVVVFNGLVYPVDSRQGKELLAKHRGSDWPGWF